MKVWVIWSEYSGEGSSQVEGVYSNKKLAENIFKILEYSLSRKYMITEMEVHPVKQDRKKIEEG